MILLCACLGISPMVKVPARLLPLTLDNRASFRMQNVLRLPRPFVPLHFRPHLLGCHLEAWRPGASATHHILLLQVLLIYSYRIHSSFVTKATSHSGPVPCPFCIMAVPPGWALSPLVFHTAAQATCEEQCFSPRVIYLETFLVAPAGMGSHWHQVCGSQDCCSASCKAQDSSTASAG